ncbi:MAG: hypothetical protein JSS49_02055 [Planctomycetes bacterium]|nr:hypothetical protein [Planctomycetota bacterium]
MRLSLFLRKIRRPRWSLPRAARRCAAPELKTDQSYSVITGGGCPSGIRDTIDTTAHWSRDRMPTNSVTPLSDLCTVTALTGNGRD